MKLEILDATSKVVRSYSSEARARGAGGRGGGRRGGGLPSTLPTKVGMNRFVWDLRYAGRTAGERRRHGRRRLRRRRTAGRSRRAIKARLTAGGVTKTESFTVKIDPRVAKDGVTVADLAEQTKFALKVRDAAGRGAAAVAARAPGARREARRSGEAAERLGAARRPRAGPYEDQMFIDQMSNINREIGQADQKVGASAYERFNELMKEWTALKADAEAALR